VSHVSAYAVVTGAMHQATGWGLILAPWDSETSEAIHMEFGTFHYIHCATHRWECGPSCTVVCSLSVWSLERTQYIDHNKY